MKKTLSLLAASLFTSLLFSQTPGAGTKDGDINKTFTLGKSQQKQTEALNTRNKAEDKLDILDITGLAGSVFSTMNYPDAVSQNSNASLKITLSVLTGPTKAGGYQLVFSPDSEKTPYAVETKTGITSVFFPINTFEVINQKLEQAMAQKKKVQLKITQNPNGYREGLLVF
jgi:hypothetical protein